MSSASRKVSVASDAKLLLLNIGITEISCVDTMTHPRPLTVLLINGLVFADNSETARWRRMGCWMARASFYYPASRQVFW